MRTLSRILAPGNENIAKESSATGQTDLSANRFSCIDFDSIVKLHITNDVTYVHNYVDFCKQQNLQNTITLKFQIATNKDNGKE